MDMIFGQGRFANALCGQSRELTSQRKLSAIPICIQQRQRNLSVIGDRILRAGMKFGALRAKSVRN
jgi:hypothetical protein